MADSLNLPKSKAFIYVRRSQDRDDRQVLSIEGQLHALKAIVKEKDYAAEQLPAEERTAHKPGRPIFNQMMERIDKREARHIVTWSANRLARNPVDGGRVLWAFEQGHLISVDTPNRSYRNTKEDIFLLTIEFGMSKMYSDEIRANVKRGYAAKYERGEYPGFAPTGYINVQNGQNRNIAPHPEKSIQIKNIFEQAATGTHSLDSLHKYSKSIGFTSRTDRPITKSTLFDMIKKRLYTGVFFHGGEWRIGKYEPIISVELFDQAQVGMGYKRGSRNRSKTVNHRYKGILICGYCNFSITAETKPKPLSDGTTAAYTYYHCTRKSKRLKCREPAITEVELEKQIKEQLSQIVINKREAMHCVQLLRDAHKQQVENRNTMLRVWRIDHQRALDSLARLLDMRLNDEITKDEFEGYKVKYQQEVDRTDSLIRDSSQTANEWLELAEAFFSNLVELVETFNLAEDNEKRRMLMYIGSNWVLKGKKAVFTPREPYNLLLKRDENESWRARPDSNRRSPP